MSFICQSIFAQGPALCQREAIVYCDYYQAFQGPDENESAESEFCDAVKAKLTQLFTRDAFHIIEGGPLDAGNMPENEYQFEMKFEAVTNYTVNGPNPKMTLVLKFDRGSFWDPVHWWDVEEPGDTTDMNNWQPLLAKMEQSIRNGPDIIKIIEEYEKRPENAEIGMDKEMLDPGENIDIHVFDFKDQRGNDFEPFNRIVVHVEDGEIINGAVTDLGPDYYAFVADRGMVTLKYQAPSDCETGKETITIYNSCDVLPEQRYFMHRTMLKEKLEEKEIGLNCYDATISIRKTYDKQLNSSHPDTEMNGECTTSSREERYIDESIEATVTLALKLENVQEMPIFNQTWEYYRPVSVSLTGFNYRFSESQKSTSKTSGTECAQVSHRTTVDISGQAKDYKITEEALATQTYWILVLDTQTGQGLKLIPAGYGIDYDILETHSVKSVITSKDGPTFNNSSSSTERSRSFALGPVAEEEADPTIKSSETWIQDYLKNQGVELPAGIEIPTPSNEQTIKKIHPDILVKYGDGISNLGGNGDKLIEKELDHGKQEERLHYSWSMTRKPNNQ